MICKTTRRETPAINHLLSHLSTRCGLQADGLRLRQAQPSLPSKWELNKDICSKRAWNHPEGRRVIDAVATSFAVSENLRILGTVRASVAPELVLNARLISCPAGRRDLPKGLTGQGRMAKLAHGGRTAVTTLPTPWPLSVIVNELTRKMMQ